MTEKLKQTIKEELEKLSKETQEAINSFGWEKITEEVGVKYLLDEREINNLLVETLLVLTGIEYFDLYKINIENNVGTSKKEAEEITEEITQKIFNPVIEKMTAIIKEQTKDKKLNWEQNINFVLSDGNYFVLTENSNNLQKNTGNIIDKIKIIRK